MAADLVLVVPEAGVDRVEWAKQLVHNAVRSPHTGKPTSMPSVSMPIVAPLFLEDAEFTDTVTRVNDAQSSNLALFSANGAP